MSGTPSSYRDRIYIVKDVILKLVEYGELNQTALVSFCGLNLKKHKPILDDLEANGLTERTEIAIGKILTERALLPVTWSHMPSAPSTTTSKRFCNLPGIVLREKRIIKDMMIMTKTANQLVSKAFVIVKFL